MQPQQVPTECAPALRVDKDTVLEQYQAFVRTHCRAFFDALPVMIFALNAFRQIVFVNRVGLDFLAKDEVDEVLGQRPGEAVGCVNALDLGGCGTSRHCRHCGALAAILAAIEGHELASECRLIRRTEIRVEGLNLLVKASPMEVEDNQFVIFAITDMTHEHRRRSMERIFFHDVLNLAGGMRGLTELLMDSVPQDLAAEMGILHSGMESLVDEIMAQRELSAAENGDLALCLSPLNTKGFLASLVTLYANMPVAYGRRLALAPDCLEEELVTDSRLLTRVLGNMLKNALEAEGEGGVVTLSCARDGDRVRFTVHNGRCIPQDVQQDIFRRSFSTKRKDRGLGLYSIMLLTERYLGGEPGFTSTAEAGTVFYVRLPRDLTHDPVCAENA